MPTERFLKLPEEKKEKILEALIREFCDEPLESVSINRIIRDAGISRGSFYTYFEDKQDALSYIGMELRRGNDESLKNCICLAEGDFFRALELFIQEAWSYLKKNNICSLQKNVAMQANANPLYVLEGLSSEGKESRFTELSNWIYDHVDRSKLKVADQREFQSLLVVCYINIMVTAIELCMRPGQEEELLKMHNIRMRFLQEGVLNHE